jgi:FKBP-type peptidyl-prolyl cis-trans isomerase
MKIKLLAALNAVVIFSGIMISGCSKNDIDMNKSFLNNKEKKESYVIGTDFAIMIKSAGDYKNQFSKDVFFKGFNDSFFEQKLPLEMKVINQIMDSAADSNIVNIDTVDVGLYTTIKDKQSYILGAFHADKIRKNIEIFNYPAFQKGFNDEFDDMPKLLNNDEIFATKESSRRWVEKILSSGDPKLAAEEKIKIYKDYFEENAKREIVKSLPSGLQYAVIREGNGEKVTEDTVPVKITYKAFFIDGREIDSSFKIGQVAETTLEDVIPCWREGIKLMPEGSKYKFFVPAELAYGEKGFQNVPPNTPLVYEVELVEILK